MINYSIIIPHYNIPQLLERCLDSIPERDDIQIIVVDDNSSSAIVDFDHFPGINRKNVEVIYNKKGGSAGRARNLGLTHALGKWLLFIDADDFYTASAFATIDAYRDSEYDIVFFDTECRDTQTLELANRSQWYHYFIEESDVKRDPMFKRLRCGHSIPVAKMIKRNLVVQHAIQFDETKYCNDTIFSLWTGITAKEVMAVKQVVYCITSRSGSLTTQISSDALLTRLEVILRANQIMREAGYKEFQNTILFYFRQIRTIDVLCKVIKLLIKYRGVNIYSMYKTSKQLKKLNHQYA